MSHSTSPVPGEQVVNAGAPAGARRWSRRKRLFVWGVLAPLALLALAALVWPVWRWAAVPADAPVIGVSYDRAWHAAAGISTKNLELCLVRAGTRVLELKPGEHDPETILDRVDALLLPGGGDVDPELYGGDPQSARLIDRERDEFEIALIAEAHRRDMPILGICRGIQILNVAHGGTLRSLTDPEDSEDAGANEVARRHGVGLSSFDAHTVHVERGTLTARLEGVTGDAPAEVGVNSFHAQAVRGVGDGLRVTARSQDGVIEAIECPDATFVVAVQWHPEVPPARMRYFDRLVQEARRFRQRSDPPAIDHPNR